MIEIYSPAWFEQPLTSSERRRRMARLCCSFTRNLAFHRAGMHEDVQRNLFLCSHPNGAFWREVHANFIDICVLDWCKLFADKGGEHDWRRVVDDTARFQEDLYATLSVSAEEFAESTKKIRHYRNKFVAHLDAERMMHIPNLEIHRKSVDFLFGKLVQGGHGDSEWTGLPLTGEDFARGYQQCLHDAESVYREALVSSRRSRPDAA